MITTTTSDPDQIALTRVTSGAPYQRVTVTTGDDGVTLHVQTRLDRRHGDGWADATLDPADLLALRDWIDALIAASTSA